MTDVWVVSIAEGFDRKNRAGLKVRQEEDCFRPFVDKRGGALRLINEWGSVGGAFVGECDVITLCASFRFRCPIFSTKRASSHERH